MSASKQLSFLLALALLPGCGVERLGNLGRNETARPSSAISGTTYFMDAQPSQFGANDAEGNAMTYCGDTGNDWDVGRTASSPPPARRTTRSSSPPRSTR